MSTDSARSPGRRRIAAFIIAAMLAVLVGGAVWWILATNHESGRTTRALFAPEERAPEGVRIRIEVLNATTTARLAQTATRLLRDRGFDVVSIGNAPPRDSTLVLDRTNHPEWARLVASVLGHSRATELRPDTSRYVDVTVLLGADWTPPAKAFDP